MSKPLGYLSFDVETDGPVPTVNSLLSVGVVLFSADGQEVDCLEVHLTPQENAVQNETTMVWWSKNKEAWKHCQTNCVSPEEAMQKISAFYQKWAHHYELRWVAGPACFDWMFLKAYYERYAPSGAVDIGYTCRCLTERKRVFWMLTKMTSKEWKRQVNIWTHNAPVTHCAMDDARHQGILYTTITKIMKNIFVHH